jgi:hypothetical protein
MIIYNKPLLTAMRIALHNPVINQTVHDTKVLPVIEDRLSVLFGW